MEMTIAGLLLLTKTVKNIFIWNKIKHKYWKKNTRNFAMLKNEIKSKPK